MEGTEPGIVGADAAILDRAAIATLTAAARALYPHDALPDAVYARVAERLAEAARADEATGRLIADGVAALDRDGPFSGLAGDEQRRTLQAIEGSDFFELARSTAVVEVYSDRRTWRLLGYEGPSFELGGYLHRGFDDLDWLPDPDADS
jgi:hypothetical protein